MWTQNLAVWSSSNEQVEIKYITALWSLHIKQACIYMILQNSKYLVLNLTFGFPELCRTLFFFFNIHDNFQPDIFRNCCIPPKVTKLRANLDLATFTWFVSQETQIPQSLPSFIAFGTVINFAYKQSFETTYFTGLLKISLRWLNVHVLKILLLLLVVR